MTFCVPYSFWKRQWKSFEIWYDLFPLLWNKRRIVISTPSVKALKLSKCWEHLLTFSWRRPLSYRNQSSDLQSKSMDWFLYDNGLRHERVKKTMVSTLASKKRAYLITIRGRHLLDIFPKNTILIWRQKTVNLYNLFYDFACQTERQAFTFKTFSYFFFHLKSGIVLK